MKPAALAVTAVLTMVLCAPAADAQAPVVYPAKGQSPDQQSKDKGECHVWAVQQSGFDPTQAQASAAKPGGQRVKGAARGAAVGAVGGAIAGDAGTGAAAGAAMGTVAGGMKKRDQAKQQQAVDQGKAAYDKAVAACMEGRGYTVK